MSIQQTINQGLAVAAALGTQTPQYQRKIAKANEKMAIKKLQNQIDVATESATERDEEEETPEAFDKIADLLEEKNLMDPDVDNIHEATYWRGEAERVRIRNKIRDIQKQNEANAYAKDQKQAAEEQRKKIRETIMRV